MSNLVKGIDELSPIYRCGYQQGTSDGVTRVLDILEKIDKEMLEKVKDELYEQDFKEV